MGSSSSSSVGGGAEPVSGKQGKGTVDQPFDGGNEDGGFFLFPSNFFFCSSSGLFGAGGWWCFGRLPAFGAVLFCTRGKGCRVRECVC